MKLLITGGAGYIGYSVVAALQQLQQHDIEEIVVYDNLSRKNYAFFQSAPFTQIPMRFVEGDILDERKLSKALEGIDTVLHLAAKVTTPHSDQDAHLFDQINHWGTAILCNTLETTQVRQLIYLSSTSIYGRTTEAVDESYEPHPFSFYAISKWQAEQQVHRLRDKMNVHILRSGNVYGHNPTLRIDAVVNKFMFNAHFNNRISVLGDGQQQRTYIHIDKLAQTVVASIQNQVKPGTYNVVEHNFSINQIAGYIQYLYPEVETVHVNYNVLMHKLQVKTPCKVFDQVTLADVGFLDELKAFKEAFGF